MKRAIPILGVAGLALLCVSAPAYAGDDKHGDTDGNLGKVIVCHMTGSAGNPYVATPVSLNALGNHRLETGDIVPPNPVLKDGHNWAAGMADYYKYCVTPPPPVDEEPGEEEPPGEGEPPGEEQPPVEEPPGEEQPPPVEEEQPPVEEEQPPAVVETPAVQAPAGHVAAPQSAVVQAPAAAVSRGTNQGYNAQTAVGGAGDSTTWLAGLGLLLGAGGVVAVRRRSRSESPTAG